MSRRLPSKQTLLEKFGVVGIETEKLRSDQQLCMRAREALIGKVLHDIEWWYEQAKEIACPEVLATEPQQGGSRAVDKAVIARVDMVKFMLSRVAPEPREWTSPNAGVAPAVRKFAVHFHGVGPVGEPRNVTEESDVGAKR